MHRVHRYREWYCIVCALFGGGCRYKDRLDGRRRNRGRCAGHSCHLESRISLHGPWHRELHVQQSVGTILVSTHFTDNIVRVGLNYQFH